MGVRLIGIWGCIALERSAERSECLGEIIAVKVLIIEIISSVLWVC